MPTLTRARLLAVAASAVPLALSVCKGPTEPRLVATDVSISPSAVSLVSLGATRQLSAVVKDQNGKPMEGAPVAWSSSDAAAVKVDSVSGLVTAVGNGSAQVRAVSGMAMGAVTVTVAQVAAQFVKVAGDSQAGVVGQALAHPLVVQLNDANGHPVAGAAAGFSITAGGGTVDSTSVTTNADGQARAAWTLGHGAGAQSAAATAAAGGVPFTPILFRATASAGAPASELKETGDSQTVAPGLPVPTPPAVLVKDHYGNPVAGVTVTFAVASGGGSVSGATPVTNAAGMAAVGSWTLGAPGANSLTATAAASGLAGNPETFFANASATQVTSLQPDTLVEGQTVTIAGVGFSATPTADTVTVDGVRAAVAAATPVSLTVTVPSYDCRPERPVTVAVTVAGQTDWKTGIPLHPASFTALGVGQEAIVGDPSAFCLQFRASGASEEYVVGMTVPAESPTSVMPFEVTSTGGVAAAAPLLALSPPAPRIVRGRAPHGLLSSAASGPGLSAQQRRLIEARLRQQRAELRLRRWEAANLPSLLAQARRPQPVAAMAAGRITAAPPAVGDTVVIKFPGVGSANPCQTFTPIKTVVRVVGNAGIWLTDVQNPTADSLTQAEIQSASDVFDSAIFASDTTHFGAPTDIDDNGHIEVVLSWQVNRIAFGYEGFVQFQDLVPGLSCPQSNGGEIFYGEVPDSLNAAGTFARYHGDVVHDLPDLIAHEVTHLIQVGQRVVIAGGKFPPSWEAEGQAVLAEELAGDAVLGHTSYQDYDQHVGLSLPGFYWYSYGIFNLAGYFGANGAQPDSAPDLCSVYANQMTNLPCDVAAYYGASWMFQRYIADQFGPTYPGGLVQLTRDWVMKNPSLGGGANIAALTGVDYDTLFARFATALAIDDKNNGTGTGWVPSSLSITSWNTDSLATWLESCCSYRWLTPASMAFASATALRDVRGGSTAYIDLASSGAHPADAIKFTDTGGAVLAAALRPTLWVVRVR